MVYMPSAMLPGAAFARPDGMTSIADWRGDGINQEMVNAEISASKMAGSFLMFVSPGAVRSDASAVQCAYIIVRPANEDWDGMTNHAERFELSLARELAL